MRLTELIRPTLDFATNMAGVLDYIIPPRCSLCLRPDPNGFCLQCQSLLPWIESCCLQCARSLPNPGVCGACQNAPPAFASSMVPFRYQDPIAHFIHLLKYRNKYHYATTLGTMIAVYALKNSEQLPDVLLPVPLHRRRIQQRGFNQTGLIANRVGKLLDIPVDHKLLRRVRDTGSQTDYELAQRRKNMHNAFAVSAIERYDAVAVIDDVITSGATMNAACLALKRNGYKKISAWSIAKT